MDADLRREKRAIRAIGIVGSNVSDKLLVLRALRPQFPEALFFTAGFDQAFTQETELPWTRNLLISSGFGPSLHKNVQGKIPSFRDSNQTSAYLATLLAIGDPASSWSTPRETLEILSERLLVPRIFEVKRDGSVLSLSGEGAPVRRAAIPAQSRAEAENECAADADNCGASRLESSAATVVEGRSSAQPVLPASAAWDCTEKDAVISSPTAVCPVTYCFCMDFVTSA